MHVSRRLLILVSLFWLIFLAGGAWGQVSGVVVNGVTQDPLEGARVSVQASGTHVVTGADGRFSLPDAVGENLVITAAKKGWYNGAAYVNGNTQGVKIGLIQVEPMENSAYEFMDPGICGYCHPDQYSQWLDTPKANSGTNTWVYDYYSGDGTPGGAGGFVYLRDSAHAATKPASDCASCHQPGPWAPSQDPDLPLEPIDHLSPAALDGLSCDICHKIADVDATRPNFPGLHRDTVTLSKPFGYHQIEYGVLGDTDMVDPFWMRPSYQPQLRALACATCHQDQNDPDENGDYEEPNGVVSEPTYLEWLASPYADPNSPIAADCVDCHMPSYGSTRVSNQFEIDRDPQTIRSHAILGSTPEYLENSAALSMTCQASGGLLDVEVTITNTGAGHHLPTGVTVRNMILLVEAWREGDGTRMALASGPVIDDLGGVGSPEEGYLAGLPGKLYAVSAHDAAGAGPCFYSEATGVLWDNRIPALASDTNYFTFILPPGSGTPHVRARLLYRRTFRFDADARQWTSDGHGRVLEDVLAPLYGHLMESAEWPAPVPEFTVHSLVAGGTAMLAVAGAPEGDRVFFARSLTGAGPTATPYGFSLDLSPPIALLGSGVADAGGVARLPLDLPARAAGVHVWFQAVIHHDGGGFEVTNGVNRTVN